jgi:hypothetical protein
LTPLTSRGLEPLHRLGGEQVLTLNLAWTESDSNYLRYKDLLMRPLSQRNQSVVNLLGIRGVAKTLQRFWNCFGFKTLHFAASNSYGVVAPTVAVADAARPMSAYR